MPIKGFMKTANMPDTYAEIESLMFDLKGKRMTFVLAIFADETRVELLHRMNYFIKDNDPLWPTYFDVFIPKNDLTDAIDDYLLAKAEFEESAKVDVAPVFEPPAPPAPPPPP
jgi:hypothetical protein